MATELIDADTRKRKRTQKSKEGPSARHKRPRAQGTDTESDVDHDDGMDITPNSARSEKETNGVKVTTSTSTAGKAGESNEKQEQGVENSHNQSVESENRKKRTRSRKNKTSDKAVAKKVKRPEWQLSRSTGGRYIRHDPVFSDDGKHMFAATSNELRICSVEESLVERSISVSGSSITSFALSGGNPSAVYVGTADGRVERWNWITGKKLDTFTSGVGNVTSIAVTADPDTEEDSVYLVTISDGIWYIMHNEEQIYTSMLPLSSLTTLARHVLSVASGRLVIGYHLGENKHRFVEYRIGANPSCLTARLQTTQASQKNQKKAKKTSQDSLTIALGSATGEIFVYEDVSVKDNSAAPALADPQILHWHRENVETLKWSQDGNYLISGGRETVLVLWQMVTGKKQFLPHLTAEIEQITISPNGASYAIQLADNSIMILSTSELTPTANFAGIQAQYPSTNSLVVQKAKSRTPEDVAASVAVDKSLRTTVSIHPIRKSELIISVTPSLLKTAFTSKVSPRPFLQTFDFALSRHVARQALTRNKITDFTTGPEGNAILEPDVPLMQVSHDGQWLAVVETWEPPQQDSSFLASDAKLNEEQSSLRREVYLKIWHWNDSKTQWALETRIDNPHSCGGETRPGRILDLAADPSELGFSTVGEDGCVKIWTPRGATLPNQAEDWRCKHLVQIESSGGVHDVLTSTFSSNSTTANLAYSCDGSLLAVCKSTNDTHASSLPPVHFINTTAGTLLQSLSGLYTGNLTGLAFLSNHLVIHSTFSLSIYDVVTFSLVRRHDLGRPDSSMPLAHRPRLLAIDHEDDTLAVTIPTKTGDDGAHKPTTRIHVFDLSSPKPVFSRTLPIIVTALLTVRGRRGYTLLTSDSETMNISPPTKTPAYPSHQAPPSTDRAFQDLSLAATAKQDGTESADEEMADADDRLAIDTAVDDDDDDDDDADSERPVVRPEDLALLFDSPAAVAGAMPVRAMFEAVAGLFGRKSAVQAQVLA